MYMYVCIVYVYACMHLVISHLLYVCNGCILYVQLNPPDIKQLGFKGKGTSESTYIYASRYVKQP